MFKFAFNSINPPAALTVFGSLGAHGLLALSLPILPIYSQGEPGPVEVPIVELSAEQMARIPALQAPAPFAYIPPSATQLLPVPPNFQLPAATLRPAPAPATPPVPAIPVAPRVATSPLLPSRPSGGMSPYPYPTITRPNSVVMRNRGGLLPLPPSTRVGSQTNTGRAVPNSQSFGNNPRSVESQSRNFTPRPEDRAEETLRNAGASNLQPQPNPYLPSPLERPVASPINPNQVRPVAPATGTRGTATAPTSPPLPLPTPQQGSATPSQPTEAPKAPESPPQEARNGTVPTPTNSGARQLGPIAPRGNGTPAPSENREVERREMRREKPENESQNRPQREREEDETKKPRNREEEENQTSRDRDETAAPRQESRVPAENTTPQNTEAPAVAPEGIKKEKPIPQEGNDATPVAPTP